MADIAVEGDRTIILYGSEKAVAYGEKFMKNVEKMMDITFDHKAPSIVITISQYYNGYKDILNRGGKIRCITDITKGNVKYCKELLDIVTELRHLDGMKGGIAINETEYMATTILQEKQPLTEVVYSNLKEVVSQEHFIFDTLWSNAIPAIKKIKEIEEGIVIEKTDVLYGLENTVPTMQIFTSSAKAKLDVYLDQYGPAAVLEGIVFKDGLLDAKNRGICVRLLTEITKDNLEMCKQLLNYVSEIKHLDFIKGNFSVSDCEFISTPVNLSMLPMTELIYSNVKRLVEQQQYVFDILWNVGIASVKKIMEIEEGIEIEFVNVIHESDKSRKIYFEQLKAIKKEVLLIIPFYMIFIIQKDIEFFNLINNILNNPKINLKMLLISQIKYTESVRNTVNVLTKNEINKQRVRILEDLEFKSLEKTAIAIIDNKVSMILELKSDPKDDFLNSIVFSIYSNNKIFVASYLSIFKSLWQHDELIKQYQEIDKKYRNQKANLGIEIDDKTRYLKEINNNLVKLNEEYIIKEKESQKTHEELIDTNRVKSEFISMMSHELRTPLVPIKGYIEMLMRPNLLGDLNEKQSKAVQIIYRNIQKQESLVEDMLDSTKLELGQLRLAKKMVAIPDLFNNILNDSKSMTEGKQISIILELESKNSIYCDEKRIEQVILNIVKNSVDFVPENGGKILLRVEEEKSYKEHFRNSKEYETNIVDIETISNNMIFTVNDNGEGIPADKINNLFKKFYQIDTSATRKHSGTGLGLVICKGIVEAHGGSIWIDKNHQGGFGIKFSIPMINSDRINNET